MIDDLRLALRTLRQTPAFALLAGLTIALGIAANATIFSVVRGVLLRPLPYADPDGVGVVWTKTASTPRGGHTSGEFLDIQRENQSLAAIAGHRQDLFAVTAEAGPARQLEGAHVTVDFFDVFGVTAIAGRTFSRATDAAAADRYVVIGEAAAREVFGSASGAAGRRVRINSEPHTVLGVMPERFGWPGRAAIWRLSPRPVPPSPLNAPEDDRDVRYFEAVARVRPGFTLARAQQDLDRLSAGVLAAKREAGSEPREVHLTSLHEDLVAEARPAILVLQAGVAVVLLIGCANVSGLVLARNAARRKELAVRAALGARGCRIMRTVFAESLVLGVGGGLLGLLLGSWTLRLLRGVLPGDVPRLDGVAFDGTVVAAMLGLAVVASALVGAAPAVQASRTNASAVLVESARGSSGRRSRGRAALVIAQIALSLVLLVSAGLLINSLIRLQRVDSGFGTGRVTLAGLALPQTRYPDGAALSTFYTRLLERLDARPEFESVAVGFPAPLRGDNASGSYTIDGRPRAAGGDRPFAYLATVSGGYFETMGIDVIAGRTFTPADMAADAPAVVLVNATLARRDWPGQSALGRRVRFGDDAEAPAWLTVIGVVGDVRQIGLDKPAPAVMYLPYAQLALPFTTMAVRSTAPDAVVTSALRAVLTEVDPEIPLGDIESVSGVLHQATAEPRFRMVIFTALGAIALVLAAVGLYGVISATVGQETREIGIRIALGASPIRILGGVLGRALVMSGIGVAAGLVAAALSARALGRFLYGVEPGDPLTFGAMAALLVAVAILASYLPARRVLGLDPILALRRE
jgi:predicted permease